MATIQNGRVHPGVGGFLYAKCGKRGHTDFHYREQTPKYALCVGEHRTFIHTCAVVTYGLTGRRAYIHVRLERPNCGGPHFVQDGECRAKRKAIAIVQEIVKSATQVHEMVTSGNTPPMK